MARKKEETTKTKKTSKAKERDIGLQLTDYIYKEYNLTYLPTYFFTNLRKIYNGTYSQNLKEPISPEDLFYMWQSKMDYLNKTYEYNKQHGKDMVGIQRVSYDLAILLNKYDSYKRWKEKQNAIHEQEKQTKEQHKQIKAMQKIQPKCQHHEDDNINDIIDEI